MIDPVETLARWVQFGGTWREVSRTADEVTLSLRRCDGGEEQSRITSSDPRLLVWLQAHQPPS